LGHWPQFPAVHDLGGPGGGVPGQPGDLLDADPAMAHQAHERGPQLAWRPAIADPGRLVYALEHLPDIRRVEARSPSSSASTEISACSIGEPSPAATSRAPSSLRSSPVACES